MEYVRGRFKEQNLPGQPMLAGGDHKTLYKGTPGPWTMRLTNWEPVFNLFSTGPSGEHIGERIFQKDPLEVFMSIPCIQDS